MQRVRTLAKHGPAADFAKGKQPPSFTVVSETELQNLHAFLSHDPMATVRVQQDERLTLKQASDERVKHWPNLIEALRLKKERDRQQRLEEEEEARKVVDSQEAQFQSEMREAAIQKANHMLYEQDDRVKTFTSKLFLSRVLEERAKQVLLDRQKKELVKQKEYEWALLQQETVQRAKEEEEQKLRKQKAAASKLKTEQKAQLAEVRTRKIREREEAKLEGKLIREAAERAMLKEKEQEDQRRQKAVELNKQYIDHNRRQRILREEKLKGEEEELKKIQLFAQLKEEQMLERRRRAEDKFNAQLSARQTMIDRQAAHLEALAGEAEERVLTQMRDAEKERDAKEAAEKERREAAWKDIDASRQRQLAKKMEQKTAERGQQKRVQVVQAQRQARLMEEELNERQEARKRAEHLRSFQELQMKEKEEKRMSERHREIEDGLLMQASLQKEEEMFQNYVNSVMSPYTAQLNANAGATRSSNGGTPVTHTPQPPRK